MFHYKMETLLSYRKKIEEVLQRELAEKNRQFFLEEGRLNAFSEDYSKQQERLSAISSEDKIDPREIELYNAYFERLRNLSSEQKKKVEKAKKDAAAKREQLIEALKKKKTLELLKKKQYKKYVEEIKKQEQKIIDEIVLSRYTSEGHKL